ncbi:hypothetical protein [Mesorhizobium sp.]|uniref:hypothetical protein n=1 Tax=Mesorhizobium sp. TaxID=1871066 RepID=UPI000FE6A3F8|nr:hypothetical protein [Mesorhizobium sp.]RWK44849.1 MAG: hypothetical protein EOR47_33760 [Mesorhizobium sp.]TIP39014.1 MAG: hypothetical protein E5X62_32405 [Mesorhizobium sp.]TIQ13006.1 MAG: hypothetical protein E5X57_10315 [Mesorhizobium sp.]
MGRLNHQRPILQLIDAKKRGLAIVGLSASPLGKRYLTPGSTSASRLKKVPSEKEKIHRVAVAIVDRFIANGDCTDANLLLEFAKPGRDRDALREWFTLYGGMKIKDAEAFGKDRERSPDRDAGLANPYWSMREPPKRKAFHLDVELSGLVSKARERKLERMVGDNVPNSLLDDMESVLRRHGIGFD